MGGDLGPSAVIGGVAAFLGRDEETQLVLVGREDALEPLLAAHGLGSHPRVALHPASQVIEMEEKMVAVRQKRDASISRTVEAVRDGKADALVAVGNTMAAVAVSQLRLRLIEGVNRAGIAVPLPTSSSGVCVVIDMGANTAAKAEHLVAYGVMASIYSEQVLGKQNPSVGLLNVGGELGKGDDFLRDAFERLSRAPINFIGNVEGGDIYRGNCDVVVCDGLAGNAVLKSSEAVAELIIRFLKEELRRSLRRKMGALLCKPAFYDLWHRIDYAEFGGAPLLGVKGVVIKAHGRSDARAVANAIRVARDSAENGITDRIRERMQALSRASGVAEAGPPGPDVAAAGRAAG
jgi:glycerol-3-phosphate acyltransferase PlsX